MLAERLLTAAGWVRASARLEALGAASAVGQRGDVIARPAQVWAPPLRDWSVLPDKLRHLDHVPDHELIQTLLHAVLDNEGIDSDSVMNDGLGLVGFVRLTGNARARLQAPPAALIECDGRLWLGRTVFVR